MDPHVGTSARFTAFARTVLFGLVGVVVLEWGALRCSSATNSTHWAFQPLVRPAVPASERAGAGAIDAFVAGALEKNGRALAPEAEPRTLIRRLSFDLRGLPPSPEEVAGFLEDPSPGAYAQLVEKFLSSPRYGERWGRHWLDVVAYADSNGYFSADTDRPLAWKFRDYVVRSIGADKPLDRFIQEQIAGDELAGYVAGADVTPEMVDPLIATHFWRNAPDGTGESDGNPLEVKVDRYAVIEGSVQMLGSAFLGLTLQCARCHDHKFEPVTQEEYYGLQAILRPAFDFGAWLKPEERVIQVGTRVQREAYNRRNAEVERDLRTLRESLEGLTAPFRRQAIDENIVQLDASLRKEIQNALDTKEKDRTEAMKSLLKTKAALVEVSADALQKRFPAFAAAAEPIGQAIKTSEANKPAPLDRIAATFEPTNAPPLHHLLIRGNHATEGKEIAPGTPAVLRVPTGVQGDAESADEATNNPDSSCTSQVAAPKSNLLSSGRRLELARWITSPENPVVARVLVNRVWHHHFGQGLVSTIDNLGQSGRAPVHPELLDWLATELVRSGWSLKHLHRLILNSTAWKQRVDDSTGMDRASETGLAAGVPPEQRGSRGLSPHPEWPLKSETGDESLIPETRRLDAESLRDAMLAVSGELDLSGGGPYVPTTTDEQGQDIIEETHPGARRRSMYLQQRRTHPVSFLSTFDGPAHNPVCVQRVSSTVALQSLSMLNSEFVRARARAFARRVLAEPDFREPEGGNHEPLGQPPASLIRARALQFAFELAYSRPATEAELTAAQSFLREQADVYAGQADAAERTWTDLCQMLLASSAFLYVD